MQAFEIRVKNGYLIKNYRAEKSAKLVGVSVSRIFGTDAVNDFFLVP